MIRMVGLALYRGDKCLFKEADLSLYPGWKVGITGANGTGKSSLLALLQGQLSQDQGELSRPSGWSVAQVSQETPAVECSALDYLLDGDHDYRKLQRAIEQAELDDDGIRIGELHAQFEAIDGYNSPYRAAKLLAGLGFSEQDHQKPVKAFSGGWRMRLNLAQALLVRSDLLLLDEPTNHLDLDTTFWLQDWLKVYPGTLLLISHDRDFLDEIIDHTLNLSHQKLTLYTGNYSQYELQRAARMEQQQAAYEKQQGEVEQLHQFIDRFRAKASKAKQAQSRIKSLERMERLLPAHADSPFHFSFPPPVRLPSPLLTLDGATIGYGATPLLSGVELRLAPGDRYALLGHNGAGKSTVIKALQGENPLMRGELRLSPDTQVGYFAQHQLEQLDGSATPLLHLSRLDPKATEQSLRSFLGGFGFIGDKALANVGHFSGGEKSRLVLAMLVFQRPNLLLLDEPTNHLDLEMRHALTLALQSFEGAIVMISHDRHLLRSVTEQFMLVDGGRMAPFDGDLDDYHDWLRQGPSVAAPLAIATGEGASSGSGGSKKDQRRLAAERRTQLQPITKQIKKYEQQMEKLHQRQQALEQQLADANLYQESQRAQLKQLLLDKRELDQQVEQVEMQWMELSEKLEQMELELVDP